MCRNADLSLQSPHNEMTIPDQKTQSFDRHIKGTDRIDGSGRTIAYEERGGFLGLVPKKLK